MSDIFDDRKKALEEEYFRKKEQELIAKLQQRARAEAEREGLAKAAGVTSEQILEALREMGLDRETVALLHFIPLLEVAWSDGSVSAKERAGILEMAGARGITDGSPAHQKLLGWLGNRPDSVLFGRARRVMRDLLASMTEDRREMASRDLVAACEEIAAASGGILGIGSRTSAEEREVIKRVAAEIQKTHEGVARRVAGSL
jgi:alkylhydroperoxidase family enzyme